MGASPSAWRTQDAAPRLSTAPSSRVREIVVTDLYDTGP
jgi:hypothetical protein